MKKQHTLITLSVFSLLAFASCKKDYTCTCSLKAGGFGTGFDTTIVFEDKISDRTKKQAEAECRGAETAYQKAAMLVLGTASCDLEKK